MLPCCRPVDPLPLLEDLLEDSARIYHRHCALVQRIFHARWLALLGSNAYDLAIWVNTYFNKVRRIFGLPYWSLSKWAKLKVKNAVNYIGAFEQTLAAEARRHGADGVICGHIHCAKIHDEHGVRYMNCGDWVESCTALVEHDDGRFEILTWSDPLRRAMPATWPASRAA